MSLQTVLAEVEPGWYAAGDGDAPDPALLRRARGSALGERILARWLLQGHAAALLAPQPQRDIGAAAVRWPRAKLRPFLRDLGVLAMAPAIRAEIGRDAVRRLKQQLGNSYLLALDRTVWDARVPAETMLQLGAELAAALRADAAGDAADAGSGGALQAMLKRHGRAELSAWSPAHDAALGEWSMLLHPPEPALPTVLPAAQVQMLHDHHFARARAA